MLGELKDVAVVLVTDDMHTMLEKCTWVTTRLHTHMHHPKIPEQDGCGTGKDALFGAYTFMH